MWVRRVSYLIFCRLTGSNREDLQESLEKFGNLDELPDDFEARVRSYEQDKGRLERDLGHAKEDRERWEKKAAQNSQAYSQLSPAIGAASIVAKVYREALMREYHALWPEYGFDRHKGSTPPQPTGAPSQNMAPARSTG